jgi:hypothetical protein
MEKPITMIMEDTKDAIISTINNSKLPAFILENIIKDIYMEINQMTIQQAKLDKEKYEEAMSKEKKN